jgi:RNA recognition motif-containing protein
MDAPMRDADGRQPIQQLIPPSREEIARTIFIGNIPAGVSDEGMNRILACAGHLTEWKRAADANNKPQTFGFAEFGDAESLETAAEIFQDIQVPTKRQEPGSKNDDDDAEVEKTKLLVMVDDASIKYAEDWKSRRKEDETAAQFRIDNAKGHLQQVISSLFNPPNSLPVDHSGDMMMPDVPNHDADGVEVVNIAFNAEDELADIPADMREIVAAEIAAFRDRSNRRDQERLRREEEIEAEERRRAGRRTSPPASAPTGPGGAGGANGVPLGPRADRGIQGAPSGPKGSQFPRDYQSGVSFVNGGAINNGVFIKHEDDDDSASDEEIERRRKKKQDEEHEDLYRKKLNQWLKHENRNATSIERQSDRLKNEEAEKQKVQDAQAKYLENFDDDAEASKRSILFYRDHGEYMREREKIRDREVKDDAQDRAQEQREVAAQQKQKDVARGMADNFLEQQAEELSRAPRQPQPFKLSLGAATKKIEEAAAPRRTAVEVENLLDDEEVLDTPTNKKRTLIPINFDASVRANLTAEEIVEAQQQLAREIPSDKEGLWKWKISWEHLPDKSIDTDIKKWAEKKILDIMGIQEDLLVDAIVDHLKAKGEPQELVENLEVVSTLDRPRLKIIC